MGSHYAILSFTLTAQEEAKEADDGEFTTGLRDRWARFIEEDLPRVDAVFRNGAAVRGTDEDGTLPR